MRLRILATLLAIPIYLVLAPAPAQAAAPPFVVIVAADVDERSLSRETLSFIFQRKQNFWKNGKRIQPVNLPPAHALRRAFSECVLGQEPEALGDYWREMYFHGVLPPHVLESEEAVVLFVNSTPGAIGYVSACMPNMHAKVVFTVGDAPNCPKRSASCLSLQDG